MKKCVCFVFSFLPIILNAQYLQIPCSGSIERIENFDSNFVPARNIDIWLPENYDGTKKFAVLYMHDGQMLFDSTNTWNNKSWNVDAVLAQLIAKQQVKNTIVVGIWNNGVLRREEYLPQKPFEALSEQKKEILIKNHQKKGNTNQKFVPYSDNYLLFLVKELKPYIDKNYAVFTNPANTFIAGSSMGGLISWYALCQYPRIFGGAACLSTHWIGFSASDTDIISPFFIEYLSKNLPKPKKHKLYFDTGNTELDAYYPTIQQKVDSILMLKGYNNDFWTTKYFDGKGHNEDYWHSRLHIPLLFLLKEDFDKN